MSKIPTKKHTGNELSRIKAQGAIQMNQNVAQHYTKQLANKFSITLGYLLPLLTITWWIITKARTETQLDGFLVRDIFIMVIPIFLALLIALWIAVKRVLSRHNAAFIFIVCLFCCFPVVTAINSNETLQANLLSLIGKEMPIVKDPLLEDEISSESESNQISNGMSEAERKELIEYQKRLEIEYEDALREKATEETLKKRAQDLGS